MTRAYGTTTFQGSVVATWKTAVQEMSDLLRSVLTQTSDTGQVNWTNVTTLPTTETNRDYEVFRFTDTLQATKPIFVRVDYRYRSAGACPQIGVTVGTETNGAGVIGGTVAGQFLLNTVGGTASVNYPAYVSTDGSYITFAFGFDPGGTGVSNAALVAIERHRNSDGTANGEGYIVVPLSNGAWQGWASRYTNGNTSPSGAALDTHPAVLVPQMAAGTSFVGDTVFAYPIHGFAPTLQSGSAAILWAFINDLPRMAEIALPIYGGNARWLAFGSAANVRAPHQSGVTASTSVLMAPILRWD